MFVLKLSGNQNIFLEMKKSISLQAVIHIRIQDARYTITNSLGNKEGHQTVRNKACLIVHFLPVFGCLGDSAWN